ncbi:hypothetical protein [Flagellimonas sp. GZD32]|uniref:hypothetical protein n=1 Tax=Flagellimonas cixiensis TaxID=3228750 RepID=UPI0035C8F8A0
MYNKNLKLILHLFVILCNLTIGISCKSKKITFHESYKLLLRQEFGITKLHRKGRVQLQNNQLNIIKEGLNKIKTDSKTINFNAHFTGEEIQNFIQKDTNESFLVISEWNLKDNELIITTTDFQGNFKSLYSEAYILGNKMGFYSDIKIDSLGLKMEEWGEINRINTNSN